MVTLRATIARAFSFGLANTKISYFLYILYEK